MFGVRCILYASEYAQIHRFNGYFPGGPGLVGCLLKFLPALVPNLCIPSTLKNFHMSINVICSTMDVFSLYIFLLLSPSLYTIRYDTLKS